MSRGDFLRQLGARWWLLELVKLVIISLLVAYLFFGDIRLLFITVPYLIYVLRKDIRDYKHKLRQRQLEDFLSFITCVSGALMSGYALEGAFRYAIREIEKNDSENTLRSNLTAVMNLIDCGASVELALGSLGKNIDVIEAKQLQNILALGKKYGGNTVVILKQFAKTLRDKQSADKEIATMIAAKKLEGKIMQVMPFLIVAYMKLTSRQQFAILYKGVLGKAFMAACLLVIIAMGVVTDKIIDKCEDGLR